MSKMMMAVEVDAYSRFPHRLPELRLLMEPPHSAPINLQCSLTENPHTKPPQHLNLKGAHTKH